MAAITNPVTIPIRSLDQPGSEGDEGLAFMPMPREMSTFEMPRVPQASASADVASAQALLHGFVVQMGQWLHAGGEPPVLELAGLPPATLRVLNEALGEGEVAAIVDAGDEVRIQETVFCGVWRQQHFGRGAGQDDNGNGTHEALHHDLLLAAPIPELLPALAAANAQSTLRELPLPPGAMNVQPLLHELQEAMHRSGADAPAHVINLTLLPLSREDSAHLDAVLDGGSVVMLSRGFGNCRVSSTAARHVWRVQYFNNMQTLILNTLEVAPLPLAAQASREDLMESHERLAELVQWMRDAVDDS
jgi:hydrogenase-1 operon protein HyaF